MKKAMYLLASVFFLLQTACGQGNSSASLADSTTMHSTFNRDDDYIVYDNQPKTGYFIQINNQNCHYKILVNDILNYSYHNVYPGYSIRPMLNYQILKSGIQHLTVMVTPLQSNTLSANADLTIQVIRYADLSNKTDYGGSTVILEWELPPIDKDTPLPLIRFDTTFHAEVPYEMNSINYASDLREMDKDILLKEVVSKFREYHQMIWTDYDRFNAEARTRILSSVVPTYKTRKDLEEVLHDNKLDFADEEYSSTLQPIENFKMVLYGNGKLATLERLSDSGRIIWCKDPETGEEILSLPLVIYKDTRDNQWHIW